MKCKIDHKAPGALPAILCRGCHPLGPAPEVARVAEPEAVPEKDRRRLPRTMTPEAWALLEAIEAPKRQQKAERLAQFKAKEAERKAADPEAYKLEKRSKARAKRAARRPLSGKRRRRRNQGVTQKPHKRKISARDKKTLARTR